MFETPERRSPEVDHSRRSRRDAWHSICNSGYKSTSEEKGIGMFETPEHRSPEVDHSRRSRRDVWRSICNSGYGVLQRKKALECLKLPNRSPEVDHNRRSQRDTWCSICNSGYRVLQRKKALECLKLPNVEVPKWITVVDHEGTCGTRSITLGTSTSGRKGFGAFETPERRSPEVNQGHRNP
jgi:hypothetical protein